MTYLLVIFSFKKRFPELYRKDSLKIFLLFFCILISFVARIGFNFFQLTQTFEDFLFESLARNDWWFPLYELLFNILVAVIPFGALIFSLIFIMNQ
jgi:hypothetical protein